MGIMFLFFKSPDCHHILNILKSDLASQFFQDSGVHLFGCQKFLYILVPQGVTNLIFSYSGAEFTLPVPILPTWLHWASLYLIQLLGPREMLLLVHLLFNVSVYFWKSICMSIWVREIFRAIICPVCPKSYCLAFSLFGFLSFMYLPALGKWEGMQNYTPRFPSYCE